MAAKRYHDSSFGGSMPEGVIKKDWSHKDGFVNSDYPDSMVTIDEQISADNVKRNKGMKGPKGI